MRNWKTVRDIKEFKDIMDSMREILDIQGSNGNWNYDAYMHGLYNGMEYMLSLAEGREPEFRNAPDEWLSDKRKKRQNFGTVGGDVEENKRKSNSRRR